MNRSTHRIPEEGASQPDDEASDGCAVDEAPQEPAADDEIGEPKGPVRPSAEPVLPDRSLDDTDTGWGERPQDDDERYLRDVPPHW